MKSQYINHHKNPIKSDISMDWFKGKFTGNHRFSHSIWGFPVKFPLIQSIEILNHHTIRFSPSDFSRL
jgi:hypothetical protein